jgi:hypothetical protein
MHNRLSWSDRLRSKLRGFPLYAIALKKEIIKMKQLKILFILVVFILFVSCFPNKDSNSNNSHAIKIAQNLNKNDFKAVLIGEWNSKFTYNNKQNIKYVKFNKNQTVDIIIFDTNKENKYSGNYLIIFPKKKANDTIVTIKITPKNNKEIILENVHFGLHNCVHMSVGLLLRIDNEPFGVMKKIK